MKKLPFLLSIPHGGEAVPEEIAGRFQLDLKGIRQDGDSFTRNIYGLHDRVETLLETPIARAAVDLNRDVSDRPPRNPDGVIKSRTCVGKTIYRSDAPLDEATIALLLEKYHEPYHQKIRTVLDDPGSIRIALDCHSMEAVGPEISPDPGEARPLFCLGSNFGKSCPHDLVDKLAASLRQAFELKQTDIVTDRPFAGGFITRTYGGRPIPWIQVEMNRIFYLSPPWFDEAEFQVSEDRLAHLNRCFLSALELFAAKL